MIRHGDEMRTVMETACTFLDGAARPIYRNGAPPFPVWYVEAEDGRHLWVVYAEPVRIYEAPDELPDDEIELVATVDEIRSRYRRNVTRG